MWLFSSVPENSVDETVMEMHGADALYSPAKSLMHAIRTKDEHAHQDAADQIIQIAKPWTNRRWSELNIANGKPLVRIPKENAHLVDLEWTEEEHAKLNTAVERCTPCGASGEWEVN
jgi:hypothetical protein